MSKFNPGDLVRITQDEYGAPEGALVYVLGNDRDVAEIDEGEVPGFYYVWEDTQFVASDTAAELAGTTGLAL